MIFETFDGLSGTNRDVCIIGAGPVGISLADELSRLGFSVLVLESGRRTPDPYIQELSRAHLVSPDKHDDMSIAVARRLGGTSNLWGGICLRFDPIDFIPRPGLVDARWPITYEDLLPYYDNACWHTQSGAPIYELSIPGVIAGDNEFSFDTLERAVNEQKSHVTHKQALTRGSGIDVRLTATVVGINFSDNGLVQSVDVVRPDGSQRTRVPVRNVVIAAGGLESTRLLLAAQRNCPERFGGPDGPLGRYYMGHVIGDIAQIVFSNANLAEAFDFFVDAHGSYVRRRFVPSEATQLREKILNSAMFPIVPSVADVSHGSAILSAVYLALACGPFSRLIVADAIRKRHIPPKPVNLTGHAINVLKGLPEALWLSTSFLWRRYLTKSRMPGFFIRSKDLRYRLAYHSEQSPQRDSRVVLSEDLDRTGFPRMRVDLRFRTDDAKSVVRTHELLSDWLVRNRFGRIEWNDPPEQRVNAVLTQASHGTHQIGTIRMGADRNEGVVNRDLRTFDSPNLFVASTAILPTSGQANPTLTAIALAMRMAHTWKANGLPCTA